MDLFISTTTNGDRKRAKETTGKSQLLTKAKDRVKAQEIEINPHVARNLME